MKIDQIMCLYLIKEYKETFTSKIISFIWMQNYTSLKKKNSASNFYLFNNYVIIMHFIIIYTLNCFKLYKR